jgi:hypothetical protein
VVLRSPNREKALASVFSRSRTCSRSCQKSFRISMTFSSNGLDSILPLFHSVTVPAIKTEKKRQNRFTVPNTTDLQEPPVQEQPGIANLNLPSSRSTGMPRDLLTSPRLVLRAQVLVRQRRAWQKRGSMSRPFRSSASPTAATSSAPAATSGCSTRTPGGDGSTTLSDRPGGRGAGRRHNHARGRERSPGRIGLPPRQNFPVSSSPSSPTGSC